MSQEISGETIGMIAELIRRLSTGDCDESDVQEGIQALFEGKPFGKSSLSGKVTEFGGFSFTEANFRDDRLIYCGIELRRHRNGGGYVPVDQEENSPDKAYVDDKVYVGPRVMVLGPAKIHGGYFHGGTFYGGTFYGGTFRGGTFHGGTFRGGYFNGGEFHGGYFHRGYFHGGTFYGGTFYGGTFRGGVFRKTEAVYGDPYRAYGSDSDAS